MITGFTFKFDINKSVLKHAVGLGHSLTTFSIEVLGLNFGVDEAKEYFGVNAGVHLLRG